MYHKLFLPLFLILVFACNEKNSVIDTEHIPEKTDRTILLYMAGENSLSSYCQPNIDSLLAGMEMTKYKCNVLIYEDKNNQTPILWQVFWDKKNNVEIVNVRDYPEQSSTSTTVITNVISDVFESYPAKEKVLILWSHGTGWLPGNDYELSADATLISYENFYYMAENISSGMMVRSFGEDNKSNTEIWDLRVALENTNINFDAIIFDACLMSCVEVAYELKDVTKYIIASACEILAEGFPYKRIMPSLIGKTLDLEEVCRSYYDFYASNSYSIKRAGTISLIKCSEMELLADTYKDFLREEYQALSYRNISGVQQYGRAAKGMNNMFFDISDFVNTVNETRSNYFEKVMNDIITYKNATSTFTSLIINKDSYSGLSVFIPSENSSLKLHDSYRNLKWYQKVYDFNNM